jgi:hypothetical protein
MIVQFNPKTGTRGIELRKFVDVAVIAVYAAFLVGLFCIFPPVIFVCVLQAIEDSKFQAREERANYVPPVPPELTAGPPYVFDAAVNGDVLGFELINPQ